ncbi:MAG: recombination protein RecR [Bacilli bacterium]|nr:recombination protein RecR [Bacilli bacterium]
MYPESLEDLIESFKLLPGIGEKTAERLAFYILNMDVEKSNFLAESVVNAKRNLHKCPVCSNITDKEKCNVCSDLKRDSNVLCIVEDSRSIYLFERTGSFHGFYHVLDNLISPLDGVNPEDIGIEKLVKRIEKSSFSEIIIAVKPTIEGETTSLYIKKILEGLNIKVTRIASGIPLGADIEYIDSLTLERALLDRKEIE